MEVSFIGDERNAIVPRVIHRWFGSDRTECHPLLLTQHLFNERVEKCAFPTQNQHHLLSSVMPQIDRSSNRIQRQTGEITQSSVTLYLVV